MPQFGQRGNLVKLEITAGQAHLIWQTTSSDVKVSDERVLKMARAFLEIAADTEWPPEPGRNTINEF